jgi:hypothetical protein
MKAILFAFLVAAGVQAASLKDAVRDSLEAGLAAESGVDVDVTADADMGVEGVQNCGNKCQNLLNNQAYMQQSQTFTYEYVACLAGCQICQGIQNANDTVTSCSVVCKNTDWNNMVDPNGNAMAIQKGVIEPDKACIMGCIIQLCQEVCIGGTPDMNPSPTNQPAWWGNGGCSIKTGAVRPGGYYSQNSQYNYANNPSGQGGQSDCCANAFSLCNYKVAGTGDTSTNQANVLQMAQKYCGDVPGLSPSSDSTAICNWFTANCGSNLVG